VRPLVPYYTESGILVAVDADQPPESVTADIKARSVRAAAEPAAWSRIRSSFLTLATRHA